MTADQDNFYLAFRGHFSGVLAWAELDQLWARIRSHAEEGWYLYRPGDPVPKHPASPEEVANLISRIDAYLRDEHREDYCGIVYTDSRTDPSFVKVFDPRNLGVVCGSSDHPPLPGWILSRIPPSVLPVAPIPKVRTNRFRFWRSS